MFLGEFDRSLDPKGRVVLPAEHRDELGESGFITKALDRCLAIFPPEEFEEVMAKMEEYARRGREQRRRATQITAGAHRIVPDKQGRVAIPQNLRNYAGLTGDVKVVGGNARIEIWDSARWRETHPPEDEGFDPSDTGLAALGV
ncbi:MAG: division/cell wall cluster transcriptional repressor MraZ [Actinomycetota bacterium]|nr:division/cell wall cluster transcriptional repressor MraZ [Actinomycetota bacterium]